MSLLVIPATQYHEIFVNDRPLMDVRATVECLRGAFPYASNLPLMADNERAQVGTCYKNSGQQTAMTLGYSLVNGVVKQHRIDAWLA